MSRQEVELLQHVYDDWAQGDFHSGRDLLDDDLDFRMGGPDYPPTRGRTAVEEQLRSFFEAWAQYSIHAEGFVDAGDKVFVEGRQRGYGKQSGAEVDSPLFAVWTFRNEKVVGLEFFFDEQKARSAAGLT
jgi:ketosteroid isomerase-like protein